MRGYLHKIKTPILHYKNLFSDRAPKFLILAYHRVLPEVRFNPANTIISLKTFIRQLDTLARKFPIVSMGDMITQCRGGEAKDKLQVVLTFDDGYEDNYSLVFPRLRQKGLPAAFFPVIDYLNTNRPVWDWEMIIALNDVKLKNICLYGRHFQKRTGETKSAFTFRVLEWMKTIPGEQRQEIMEYLNKSFKKNDPYAERCLNWDEVIKMKEGGMDIGSHSLSHASLARIPFEEAVNEIKKSKEEIEKKIKKMCLYFAFPFGSSKDYNNVLVEQVRQAGYKSCLLNIHGYNLPRSDCFSFKRIVMQESTNLRYLLG